MAFVRIPSIYIISKQPRIFLLIIGTLTSPQALLALIHEDLALFTIRTIAAAQLALVKTPSINTFRTNQEQLYLYSLLEFVTLLVYCILCILSVSAVTYTAALVHYRIAPAGDQISFKKVMRIIHRVWKSVVGTELWIFLVVIVSKFIILLVVGVIFVGLSNSGNSNGAWSVVIAGAVIIMILYWVALVYFMIIASLALVISVIESGSHGYGYQSLVKSKALLKGNVGKAIAIYFIFNICTALVRSMLDEITVNLLGFVVMVFLFLYWYVLQTVLYAVCKFYHGESIDNATILYLESTAYTPLIVTAEDKNEQV